MISPRISAWPASVLLDKGVVRRVYELRARVADELALTNLQLESAQVFDLLRKRGGQSYLTRQTANVLRRRRPSVAAPLLADTRELQKGRYLRRWARRLRGMAFSPEDAIILAYGNFGIDWQARLIAVEVIVTTDLKLAAHFLDQRDKIEARFTAMVSNLPEPYSKLRLPFVITTTDLLKLA